MKQIKYDQRYYLQSELLDQTNLVCHGFTGRLGGVSTGKIAGLNLGFRVGDDPDAVRKNYQLVAEDLSLNLPNMVLSKQTHTDNIRIVTQEDAGKGIFKASDIEDTDGLITNLPEIPLMVFAADCVPILFFDPVCRVIAAVHAGWRGTVKGIAGKTVTLMQDRFGSQPKDLLVAIGPSIGPCCLTFDEKDAHVFPPEYLAPQTDGKVLVDIWAMNCDRLLRLGIPRANLDLSGVCTVCHADRYYSYRTHKERTGRQGAVIMLKQVSK